MNQLFKNIFERQTEYSVRDKFDHETDHKQFFLCNDGLHNLEEDLVYTILGRYTCKSNCQICFLKGHWLSDIEVYQHSPTTVDETYEEETLKFFDRFNKIDCIDDLRNLKNHFGDLFDFYKRNSHLMEFHTSDNGFFSQYDILMNDVRFANIGQLSFSDHVLSRGNITDKIISMIPDMHERSPIRRLNIVMTKGRPEDDANVERLCEWFVKTIPEITLYFHNDIRYDVDFFENLRQTGYHQPSAYYIETSTTPVTKCNVLTETIHMRYKYFFPDLYTSMDENRRDFYGWKTNIDCDTLMTSLLREKISMYSRNVNIMTVDNKLKEYFKFVSEHVKVNDDFTYIPISLLSPCSRFYKKLIENDGYINTNAGLIKRNCSGVKPILEFV